MEWIAIVAINGFGLVVGLLIGSVSGYRRGWHGGLSFRNGCDQEVVNVMSRKDATIHELKCRIAKAQQALDSTTEHP